MDIESKQKGGEYHARTLRNREHEILFMDLRTWTENAVKGEGKKKVLLGEEQIQKAADIYHTWQSEGTDGTNYAAPELYRSVGIKEIETNNWSLVPSKYIEFIDHDLDIDFKAEMSRIQQEMRDILAEEKQSQKCSKMHLRGSGMALTKIKLGKLISLSEDKNTDNLYSVDHVKGISIQKSSLKPRQIWTGCL